MNNSAYLQQIRNTFVVQENDSNDNGALSPCAILREITLANDTLIRDIFDTDTMEGITVLRYNLDIPGIARRGDHLQFHATGQLNEGILETSVRMMKKKGKATIEICFGTFQFRKQSITRLKKQTYADTIRA